MMVGGLKGSANHVMLSGTTVPDGPIFYTSIQRQALGPRFLLTAAMPCVLLAMVISTRYNRQRLLKARFPFGSSDMVFGRVLAAMASIAVVSECTARFVILQGTGSLSVLSERT